MYSYTRRKIKQYRDTQERHPLVYHVMHCAASLYKKKKMVKGLLIAALTLFFYVFLYVFLFRLCAA